MDLIASGRDADVYALDDARVLRRYRDGRSAEPEAAIIRAVDAAGYPTPTVLAVEGPDLVLERVAGPTLAGAILTGAVTASQAGAMLAGLHDELHALPWDGGAMLHLDLHPANVLLSPERPVVIDWSNARPGDPGLDVALTALICAQVALDPAMASLPPEMLPSVAEGMRTVLEAFAATVTTPYADHLSEAAELRGRDVNLSAAERDVIPPATDLAREAVRRAPS